MRKNEKVTAIIYAFLAALFYALNVPCSERLLDDALCRFLDSLTAEQRTTFVLRYYYAMPLPEIAARKQVSVSTVKVTLMRLRKKLRQYLELEGLL